MLMLRKFTTVVALAFVILPSMAFAHGVATGLVGSHFHRSRRCPGPRLIVRHRNRHRRSIGPERVLPA